MAPTYEIVEMTPQMALAILEKNHNNRTVRQSKVDMYAADMAAGVWKFNGAPIVENGTGKLADGQHRLLACVQSGKSFRTALVRGITDDAHRTIDTGMSRTMADELRWSGEQYAPELAALLAILWKHDNGSILDPRSLPSRAQLGAYLKKHPELRESVKMTQPAKTVQVRPTALAACHFLLLREYGEEIADRFVVRLVSGTDYGENDPLLALRSYALGVMNRRMLRPSTAEWFALVVKTANSWLLGRPVSTLRWRRSGAQREGFPALVMKEDAGDLSVDEL